MGKVETVSIQSKYVYPYQHIREESINPDKVHKLQNCIVLWQEVTKISRKDQLVMVVTHPDFKSGDDRIKLHAVKRWFVVYEEVNRDYLFHAPAVAEQ